MPTTRFISKDGLRIIDEHDDGRNFFYFADRRLDGFAVRRANGTSFLATSGASYNTGNTEADKPLSHADITDGGFLNPTRRQRWNRMMLLEWFAWPAVQAIEATWTSENNNIKKAEIRGALVAWGFSMAQAQTVANNYIPGGTKPTQANLNDMTNLPADLRDLMDCSEQNNTDDYGTEIEAHRTGRRSKDIRKAFADLITMHEQGWPRLFLEMYHDGFIRVTLERGSPETGWQPSQHFYGDEDQVTRDVSKFADYMYQCAKGANDAP